MNKFLLSFFVIAMPTIVFAQAEQKERYSDCIILKDEDSIICKYVHTRINIDTNVSIQWIEPNGDITRQRDIKIPAGHASIYYFRYIKGRTVGTWGLKVIENNQESITNFTIE
jgi:hypothetical protein